MIALAIIVAVLMSAIVIAFAIVDDDRRMIRAERDRLLAERDKLAGILKEFDSRITAMRLERDAIAKIINSESPQ